MNHTPGPWKFDTSIENDVYLGQILAPSRAIVSLFRHHDRNDKNGQLQEDLANARLIAAAPAMLEALEFTSNILSKLTTFEFQYGGDRQARDMMEKAIQQAKGNNHEPT